RTGRQPLMIATEATPPRDPGKGSFDDPSPGQRQKARPGGPLVGMRFQQRRIPSRPQPAHDLNVPPQMLLDPCNQRPAVMTVPPEQLEPGKALFEGREQPLGSRKVGSAGRRDLDLQEMAFGIHQSMPFASPDFFPHIKAFFRTANRAGFDRLAVNHSVTGLLVSTLLLPHLFAQG